MIDIKKNDSTNQIKEQLKLILTILKKEQKEAYETSPPIRYIFGKKI